MRQRLTLAALIAGALCGACSPPAFAASGQRARSAATPVPPGFVGMNITAPVYPTAPLVLFRQQLREMTTSGVESIRVPVYWGDMQPTKNGPIQFGKLDQLVALCAARRLTILPVVLAAPAWDAAPGTGLFSTPRTPGPYASFIAALIHRYGPHGRFWRTHSPKVPIRLWQIWNEPNIVGYWPQQPFAKRYVTLLRASRAAIKRADPGAKLVLGGMPNASWYYLNTIYRAGGKGLFDYVAVHPYTTTPKGVITILSYVRRVMDQNHDSHTPMLATEIGWPAGLGVVKITYGVATTEKGQAAKWKALVPLLLRHRRALGLVGFYYYDWASTDDPNGDAFAWSGLYLYSFGCFIPKPVAPVFAKTALAMENRHTKASIGTECASPG